uniref:Leucine-rich repeat protein 1 n=1 Tax=Syphacia muris TaxID=451379 RepID=A0A0N5ATV2_9BILA
MAFMAGAGVTQVVHRCESAKVSGNLDLSGCSLTCVPNAVYFILKGFEIYSCNLRQNELKSFPKKLIEKFPKLTGILEDNAVESIPAEIGDWKTIRGLNLSKNKLTTFPEPLLNLQHLNILDLSNNQITDVERISESLPELTHLNLSGNPLSTAVRELLNRPNKLKTLKVVLE